jgi:Polyketide cyclase / dehydrase and lipid transport
MAAIVTSTEVDRPAAEVFAYATDPARFGEWQQGVVDGHMDGPADDAGSPAVGSKCVTTRRIGGANRPSTAELVHIDPPRTWSVRGIDGPIRAAVDVLVEPVTGARSRLTISVDFTGHGIGKILVPLVVRREARKEMPDNIAALKQRLEASKHSAAQ